MEAEKTAAPDPPSPASDFLGKYRTRFSWDAVWDHLRQARLLEGDPPPIPDKPAAPWYIAAQLALGGWISALFFICFLVLFVSMTLEIHSPEGPLFVGGICFLTIAGLLMRRNSLFTEQFALALALAGSGAAAGAVFMATEDARTALLIASFVIAATYPFIHNGAYRHVAAVAGLLSFFVGLDFLVWNLEFAWHDAHEIMSKPWIERLVMIAAWHVFLGVFAAYGRLTEHQWRTKARLNALLPPLLNGAYCVLLLSVAISLLNSFEFWILAPYGRMAGIGAGVALMYCAHILTAALDGTSRIRLLFLGLAVMTAVGGWFLPGLSVGLLGLALGRLRGSFAVLLVANTAMLLYFICYYYNLDTSLMYKSIALAGSGVFLCLAAWFIGRRQDTGTGGEDA
jgi:MFS family permease